MAAAFQLVDHKVYLELRFTSLSSGNALGLEAAKELAQIAKAHKNYQRPVVVTSGNSRLFCSGGNRSDHKKLKSKTAGLGVARATARQLDAFARWPVVKLALIEGDVLGGGMEWLARFDFRWSTQHALFSFWQKRLGLSTGWSGGKNWANRIGELQVRQLLLEGKLLSAFEAHELGLVDRVVSPLKIRSELLLWCERHTPASTPHLVRWTPQNERTTFGKLWWGPEHRDSLKQWK